MSKVASPPEGLEARSSAANWIAGTEVMVMRNSAMSSERVPGV
jgi:hypothetical protein